MSEKRSRERNQEQDQDKEHVRDQERGRKREANLNDLNELERSVLGTITARSLVAPDAPVLLMVSGGSDSTALAYVAARLAEHGFLGPLALLHVNHQLRGADADADEVFVTQLANVLRIPLFTCAVDIAGEARRTGGNVEAVGRQQRYLAANEALESMCLHESAPLAEGRIFTAHTADDRIENFYMRSIVGTGPGGFRSMRYENGPVVRPLMDVSREALRSYIADRERSGLPMACDDQGKLWREDATNAHTDKFRAYVRHEIVPKAKQRNDRLVETLCRTMNLIADEDDLLERLANELSDEVVAWLGSEDDGSIDYRAGCTFSPVFGQKPRPLQRRVVVSALRRMLSADVRIETAAIDAVLAGFDRQNGAPRGGYVANIQGDLAVSANKHGVRVEPMEVFRARRKRNSGAAS
ncbi:tRNA lysidine(34) synthetase TilS [Adlercreutzia sp. ZJ141]|uniref:tRNA lysidine(34) synthetase TilS n=1 Tax=Adlercreutzia sp. ZJ141 TaxID=2709406 RepID=UPI0013EE20D8|nr:tRNA lysidine(34) synthetase TilS [Adlercreutzia sp. ZJ141]